ncbi:helix-turn-helix domain-containing protein [Nocardia sp. NPDC051030]|uniref:TetR/AcrR family transcriptional regulator n=1 Tax=Nocardia sp. NPDC051030 TaxID=3155162 RepID=UPI003424C0B1
MISASGPQRRGTHDRARAEHADLDAERVPPDDLTELLQLLLREEHASNKLTQKARAKLSAAEVKQHQRLRILSATAHVIAEQGFWPATVAHICRAAGVSKKGFYQHFSGKEDAFLSLYDLIDLGIESLPANLDTTDFATLVDTLASSYLNLLDRIPALTRLLLLQPLNASTAIQQRRADSIARCTTVLHNVLDAEREAGLPIAMLSDAEIIALIGGVNEMCIQHIHHHGVAGMTQLQPAARRFLTRLLHEDDPQPR